MKVGYKTNDIKRMIYVVTVCTCWYSYFLKNKDVSLDGEEQLGLNPVFYANDLKTGFPSSSNVWTKGGK